MSQYSYIYKQIEDAVKLAYEDGPSLEDAEKLASKCLYAQMLVSNELRTADLDSRMKKSGLKTVRAAVFLEEVQKSEKKPTDSMLSALVDANELVNGEQQRFDEAEANKSDLERQYLIFREAHIHFRTLSKAGYSG